MFNSLSGIYSNLMVYSSKNVNKSPKIAQLSRDTISFKGAQAREYRNSFDYMISQSALFTKEPYSSQKSPSKISNAIRMYLDTESDYKTPVEVQKDNNTFCPTYSEELKNDIVTTVNYTRTETFAEWSDFLDEGKLDYSKKHNLSDEIFAKINKNPALKLVIWQALASDLSSKNRHIPLPLDIKTLADTIEYFEAADRSLSQKELNQFRTHQAQTAKAFNEIYTSKLIENSLYSIVSAKTQTGIELLDEKGILIENPNKDTIKNIQKGIWVVIPSAKANKKQDNVPFVENLSNKNWCTRSKTDKAEAALQDGAFYIFLGKDQDKLIPQIGITSSHGELAKIQGESNNNLLDKKYFDTLESFLINTGAISQDGRPLNCSTKRDDEGPDAYNQYLIAKEIHDNPDFAKAIENKDYFTFINHLRPNNAIKDEKGNIILRNYNSRFSFQNKYSVALSDFGINEIDLLKSIKCVEGKVNTLNSPNDVIKKYSGKIDNLGENLYESINLQEK